MAISIYVFIKASHSPSILISILQPWHSTRIVSRIDERTLVSSSGKVYRLFGELDVEGMLLNGNAFNLQIVQSMCSSLLTEYPFIM